MKNFKYILPIFFTFLSISCSNNEDIIPIDETANLLEVKTLTNDTHTIEIYTETGKLTQGYNDIKLRIKDKTTENYIENATINWTPMMHMTNMIHSCPKSVVSKVTDSETLYEGYIIFQMAENDSEGWMLTVNYTIDGKEYTVKDKISVPASNKKRVSVFMVDNVKYIVAIINPTTPKVGINDFTVSIHKMESMMSFPIVENYMFKQDPRMPSMGNHTSPNNTDLVFDATSKMYKGDLSLTMTGYWKLNLMMYDNSKELIKGEEVTTDNENSSLFLELEF